MGRLLHPKARRHSGYRPRLGSNPWSYNKPCACCTSCNRIFAIAFIFIFIFICTCGGAALGLPAYPKDRSTDRCHGQAYRGS
jgi:hypothetical protein